MALTRAQIDHVAVLASLTLTDAEAARMTEEIGSILRYVDELGSIDTSNIEPTRAVLLGASAWRDDVDRPGLSREAALSAAPRSEEGGFAVPAFVEQPSSGEAKT
jgi:aspartyl-tRNA(Asn)/glutamyl-tRNA(Gln) amidotransferase subunit C